MARDSHRASGSWLEGPAFQRDEPRGARLGLPADGPGSLAPLGLRIVAFVLDGVVGNLLAGLPYLFGVTYGPGDRGYAVYAAFLLQEFILVSVAGATIGKQLCGIRVVRTDGGRLAWPWVLARTVLVGLLVPALVWDRNGRGLHDRAAGSLTLRVGSGRVARSASPHEPAPAQESVDRSARPAAATPRSRTGARPQPPVRRRKKRR